MREWHATRRSTGVVGRRWHDAVWNATQPKSSNFRRRNTKLAPKLANMVGIVVPGGGLPHGQLADNTTLATSQVAQP